MNANSMAVATAQDDASDMLSGTASPAAINRAKDAKKKVYRAHRAMLQGLQEARGTSPLHMAAKIRAEKKATELVHHHRIAQHEVC